MIRKTQTLAIALTLAGLATVASADTDKGSSENRGSEKGERKLQQVFFDFDSATLDNDLRVVADQLKKCAPSETIILDAFADPVGPQEYNADLALRRAQAVRARLIQEGISGDRIMLVSFGEKGARCPSHAMDRRVEIRTSDEPIATITQKRQAVAAAMVLEPGQVEQVARP
jgi:outer membrane protein OmpA-like peptidoglycan-associated protein